MIIYNKLYLLIGISAFIGGCVGLYIALNGWWKEWAYKREMAKIKKIQKRALERANEP